MWLGESILHAIVSGNSIVRVWFFVVIVTVSLGFLLCIVSMG